MDAAEFEQLLVDLREGRVHVRVGLEKGHVSSNPTVASLLAGQRAERIARGDRVASVYKSPGDSDDDYSIEAAIDAEQARMLLAAGAVELGAEKSSPAPNQTEELRGRGPLTDDDSVRPQPVYGNPQPFMRAPPAQTEELPGTTDAKAPADQRQGAVASSIGDGLTATGTVQGSPSAALNQEERVAEDRSTTTGVESALNARSGVGTAALTLTATGVGIDSCRNWNRRGYQHGAGGRRERAGAW